MSRIKIAPSILSADFTRLGEQLAECEDAGADWIHIDIMDGHFVPNITFGPLMVEAARRATDLPLDVHLMIAQPERYAADFASAGATNITVHVEASTHLHRTLQVLRAMNVKAGVALNPHTPVTALSEVLSMIDNVIIMTVNPGFGGQSLISPALRKFSMLRRLEAELGLELELEADGGVNAETAGSVVAAGATVLIAGNFVFTHQHGIAAGIRELRAAASTRHEGK